jgi:hypothetical protein
MARPARRHAPAPADDAAQRTADRAWWLRALLVFQAPRPVFAALRNATPQDVDARQEPVLAFVLLAGIAGVLASPTAGTLLDDPARDGVVVAIFAFLAGGIYAFFGYLIGGAAVYFGARAAGGGGTYRAGRHIFGFAVAPVALSLFVLWPVRLALYGSDSFRSDGSDSATANHVFGGLQLAFAFWALALLVIGVRTVHGWSWGRALAAVTAAAAVLVCFVALWPLLG